MGFFRDLEREEWLRKYGHVESIEDMPDELPIKGMLWSDFWKWVRIIYRDMKKLHKLHKELTSEDFFDKSDDFGK